MDGLAAEGRVPGLNVAYTRNPVFDVRASLAAIGYRRYTAIVLFIGFAYFASALLGNALRFTGNVDALWPPVGVGIALLYRFGLAFWPGILLGDILADTPHALPVLVSAGQTSGNLIEVVGGTVLILYLIRRASPLESLPGLGRFLACLVLATLISATIGTSSLFAGGVIDASEVP